MRKPNHDKPYERFLALGPESLTDTELLAIIIRTGTAGEDAVAIAAKILHHEGQENGLLCLHHMSVAELKEMNGIGEVKAVRIKCIAELSNRIARAATQERMDFHKPYLVAEYYMEQMRHLETEQVRCIMLDIRNRRMTDLVISTGTIDRSLLSSREIYLKALELHAASIMILHNHPSGDPTPSREDIAVTAKLKEAGELLQIPLRDHIIIGDMKYVSFLEHGLL